MSFRDDIWYCELPKNLKPWQRRTKEKVINRKCMWTHIQSAMRNSFILALFLSFGFLLVFILVSRVVQLFFERPTTAPCVLCPPVPALAVLECQSI